MRKPFPPTLDSFISEADRALKILAAPATAQRQSPADCLGTNDTVFDEGTKRSIIGMMRVNHVGEICAQALYQAQAMSTNDPEKKTLFKLAAQEENDHLAWTQERLKALGGRPSLLNPLWYGGAFALGLVAGQMGEAVSLGFMAETEKQVEQHLDSHLKRLPEEDRASRAIVEQMKQDEIEHGQTARDHGGQDLPLPIKLAMRAMSKVMTTLADKI
ncbi:2-nonaprenyl-3-methyl-6-methoxy-1,4-benzoquinol hydroxylase [Limnobacter litoralis]|uniref:3-demethoxyubiquinol 3-hydroxylase n=1 Tax=Limnobacter litoralis TaxID=481366 RepID=A0ABQ5YUV9_9BURK|nr:2-nonaprenyl-3-methyl-6-methoxy-1,4-benzoquinol hydroxylase [Limnobacter litoralis]